VLSPEAKNEGSGIFWHAVSGGLLRSQFYVRALFGRRDLRRLLRLKPGEIGQDEMHDLSFLLRYHFGRLALSYFTVTVMTGDMIGGLNGICVQSPSTSCRVCWPGGSVTMVSVCPPPK